MDQNHDGHVGIEEFMEFYKEHGDAFRKMMGLDPKEQPDPNSISPAQSGTDRVSSEEICTNSSCAWQPLEIPPQTGIEPHSITHQIQGYNAEMFHQCLTDLKHEDQMLMVANVWLVAHGA